AGALPGGVWAMPTYFNNTVYYGSVGSPLQAFTITNAKLSTSAAAHTANSFGYPGATPSVSANGASNGIVWAVENTNPAVLHAFDASTLNELYNSNQAASGRDHFGNGNKFMVPTIVNGNYLNNIHNRNYLNNIHNRNYLNNINNRNYLNNIHNIHNRN